MSGTGAPRRAVFAPVAIAGLVGAPHSVDGLWRQPYAKREPELYSFWKAMTQGTSEVAPTLLRNAPRPGSLPHPPERKTKERDDLPRHFRLVQRHGEASHNWSGAVVPAVSGRRFTRVAARWRVPKLPGKPHVGESDAMVSIWIGLGGWLQWSDSMPQMGSEHGWDDNGKPVHRLWCQWWQGKNNDDGWLSWIVDGLVIEPGNEILCHLALIEDNVVECYFLNRDTKELAGVLGTGSRPVVGSTAEWVVEQPMRVEFAPGAGNVLVNGYSGVRGGGAVAPQLRPVGPHPLPEFKTVILRDCAARLGNDGDFRRRTLADADPITLFTRRPPGSVRMLRATISKEIAPRTLTVARR